MIGQIIAAVGGSAVLFGAFAWLTKSLLTHFLDKDISRYKTKLETETEKEREGYRHYLQLRTIEYEIKISKLQEKRTEVVAEIYKLLVSTYHCAWRFLKLMEFVGEEPREKKFADAIDKHEEFINYYQKNRIWLSSALCTKLDEIGSKIQGPVLDLAFWTTAEKRKEAMHGEKFESWVNGWKQIEKLVPPLIAEIEKEFREVLGVEQECDSIVTRTSGDNLTSV